MNVTQRPDLSGGVAQSYETDTQTKWGLNGGIGRAFEVGRTAMFLESRYFTARLTKEFGLGAHYSWGEVPVDDRLGD